MGAHTVNATEVLRIAARHLDHFGADIDQLAICLHGPALPAFAHGQRDLVRRPTVVAWSLEQRTRHEQQRRVVVERLTGIATYFRECVAESNQHLAEHLEAQLATRVSSRGTDQHACPR